MEYGLGNQGRRHLTITDVEVRHSGAISAQGLMCIEELFDVPPLGTIERHGIHFISIRHGKKSPEVIIAGCLSGPLSKLEEESCFAPRHPVGLVIGNYVVLDKLGQGGMGAVYKAHHRKMKRGVAIKMLPTSTTKSPDAVKRFQREVEAVAIRAVQKLPKEAFTVTRVRLWKIKKTIADEDLAIFQPLTKLRRLFLSSKVISDRGLEQFKGLNVAAYRAKGQGRS